MSQSKSPLKPAAGVLVALFFAVGLYLRIALPYDTIFSEHGIKFIAADPYYFMRYIDNLVCNFPHIITFDPYMKYPHGQLLGGFNFFIYLLGGITWLVGLGSPTHHTVDVVGVYFPAIAGALTVIPVYFIGRALFNRWAGVMAAGLIVLLPGEFLARSILGRTDRDVLQVLLTALTMLFLILAVKTASQRQLTFHHLSRLDWAVIAKPLLYSFLTGVFLGVYILTWRGAFIFVFIIFAYFVIQFIIDHLKCKSTDYLAITGTVPFLVALAMFFPVFHSQLYLASLIIALMTPWVLTAVSRLMSRKGIRPACFPLAVLGLGLTGLALFYIGNPGIFAPSATQLTVYEMQPILFPGGKFSFFVVWRNFTTGFLLSLVALGILTYLVIRRGEADKTVFLVWSLVILALTLAMTRFAVHFALNVALLSGYLTWRILELAGFKALAAKPSELPSKRNYYEVLDVPKNATDKQIKKAFRKLCRKYQPERTEGVEEKMNEINRAYEVLSDHHRRAEYDRFQDGMAKREKGKRKKWGGFELSPRHAFAVIVVFFLAFFPNMSSAMATAGHPPFVPGDAWYDSLTWLKDNTADPFGNPDFYYSIYSTPFEYPDTAYGVVAWWDYGYWIVRIGHRLPVCDPGGGAREMVARFLTCQDEASADNILIEMKSKYVIIDHATVATKFHAVAIYAGSTKENFFNVYYKREGRRLVPVLFYYPEYYRSLAVRLYNFDGGQVHSGDATVISYEEKAYRTGVRYKEITHSRTFSNYEEAAAYVAKQTSGNHKIVSLNPFVSPVPLEGLRHYRLAYSSNASVLWYGGSISEVKIFEYIGD